MRKRRGKGKVGGSEYISRAGRRKGIVGKRKRDECEWVAQRETRMNANQRHFEKLATVEAVRKVDCKNSEDKHKNCSLSLFFFLAIVKFFQS